MIHIKSKGEVLKKIFKPINAVSNEFRLNITSDGLASCTVNPSNTAMLKLNIPATTFDMFEVDTPTAVGLELWKWQQKLQYVGKTDVMDIQLQMDKSAISDDLKYGTMVIDDGDGFQDTLSIIDPESMRKEPKIPAIPRTAFVTMPVGRFSKILKKSYVREPTKKGKRRTLRSEYITFEVVDGVFNTTSESDTSKCNTKTTCETPLCKVQGEGKALYPLDELLYLLKEVKGKFVEIEFSKDYPVTLKFSHLNDCLAEWMLAPRVESE